MTTASQYRALVVDDEPAVCNATMRALRRVNFECETAANGRIALEMANATRYDLIVTDLRMPEANGHQFAVELLDKPTRPAIVILTGVIEPKLSNDLRLRGVDEILFKPISYSVLADKARKIVEQRAASQPIEHGEMFDKTQPKNPSPPSETELPLPAQQISSQMAQAARGLRNPPKDFDGFARASSNIVNAHDLASAIKSDPRVADEVLSFANGILYKSHDAVLELQRSIKAFEQNAIVRAVMIFAAGAVIGWLLSWLGTGDGMFR